MAEEFGDNLDNLQKEMSNLIITGIIDGKIDEENQCLYLKKGVNTNQIIMQSYNTISNSVYDQKANVFYFYIYMNRYLKSNYMKDNQNYNTMRMNQQEKNSKRREKKKKVNFPMEK